jgi:hypothetical protein
MKGAAGMTPGRPGPLHRCLLHLLHRRQQMLHRRQQMLHQRQQIG